LAGPRVTLAILVLLSALSQVDRGIIGLLVPAISRDLGVDDFQISLLQGAAFGLFYAVFGLPCGALADRWSRRWLIFWGVTVWSLAAAACGLAVSFNQLLVARFFVGAGEAALVPAALSLISDIFPRQRLAGALAVFSIGSSLGAGVSLGLGGFIFDLLSKGPLSVPLIGAIHPWQGVFLITGAPGVLLAFAIFVAPDPARRSTGGVSVSWSALFGFLMQRRGFFARHFAGFSLMGILAYGCGGWVPVLLMRRHHFTAFEAGMSYGLVTTGGTIIGMLSLGAILDRLIRRGVTDAPLRVFVWLIPVGLAATVTACLSPYPAVFLGCWLVTSVGVCLAGPAATAIQFVTPPEMRGRTSALYIMIFNLVGFGVGPSLIGWLTVHVYRDPMAVNLSIATAYAIVAPIAWIMFFGGLKPMREAMALAEAPGSVAGRPAA